MYSRVFAAWLRAVDCAPGAVPSARSIRRPISLGASASASLSESLSGAPRAYMGRATSSSAEHGEAVALSVGREYGLGEFVHVEQDLYALIARRKEGANVEADDGPHGERDSVPVE
eukprot:scaffold19515_cov31-Tisochrysis_lutea.AAC.4